jgi:hypothetical protein
MNTQTKTAMLTILSIGMLTALTLSTLTFGVSPAFAKKKHCDKSDNGCDAKKADSNKINKDHTQASLDESQVQSPASLQPENPFALTGIRATNSTNE